MKTKLQIEGEMLQRITAITLLQETKKLSVEYQKLKRKDLRNVKALRNTAIFIYGDFCKDIMEVRKIFEHRFHIIWRKKKLFYWITEISPLETKKDEFICCCIVSISDEVKLIANENSIQISWFLS